jgi:hypothetical protein
MLQLSAKEVIRPFNAGMSMKKDAVSPLDDTMPDLEAYEDSDEAEGDDDGREYEGADLKDLAQLDIEDEAAELTGNEQEILEDTAVVQETVSKVW